MDEGRTGSVHTLRKADAGSADELVHLWTRTFMDAYGGSHSPANLRAYCRSNYSAEEAMAVLSSPRSRCVMAYRDEAAVGFYLLKHPPCPARVVGDGAELKQIYVVSTEYGSGLGQRLFEDACNAVRREGKAWIWLCVSDLNLRARRFYDKLGLKPVAAGPVLEVGTDRLPSTILALRL